MKIKLSYDDGGRIIAAAESLPPKRGRDPLMVEGGIVQMEGLHTGEFTLPKAFKLERFASLFTDYRVKTTGRHHQLEPVRMRDVKLAKPRRPQKS